jgi:hypothetical protein
MRVLVSFILISSMLMFYVSCKKNDSGTRSVDVCPVPLKDYDSLKYIRDEQPDSVFRLDVAVRTRMDIALQNAAHAGTWDGDLNDWDSDLGLGLNQHDVHSTLDIMDYFIVYQFLPGTDPKTVTLKVSVIKGYPYDTSKAPIQTFTAVAKVGDPDPIFGGTITSTDEAAEVAAKSIADQMIASGVINKTTH